MTAPAVSIAIRAYRRRWLGEAIESVLGQTFTDLELVVYDDAGDLDEVVAGFGDSRVRYHRAARRLSSSGRFTAAIELCQGRYIGVLDDDDRYDPAFVERLAGVLDDDPAAGVAFSRMRWDLGDRLVEPHDLRPAGRIPDAARDLLSGRVMIQPSLMLVRREAAEAGLANQPMGDDIAPDLFLNARVALAGWAHVLVGEALVTRRWHDEQIARGAGSHDRVVATWDYLAVDDPELEPLRAEQHARALLRRAVAHLATGDRRAARADLDAAAVIDAGAWSRPRRLMQAATRSGPLARLAATAWLESPPVRRRRDLPPDAVRDQRPR